MDFEAIKAAACGYQADMTRFLREMISHPSESCEEREVVHCIKAEMEHLGYDEVEVDGLGNVIGWMGDGEKIIFIVPLSVAQFVQHFGRNYIVGVLFFHRLILLVLE